MPMHDQVLTFFGFSRLPFGKHLTPADTFPSSAHQEALSRLSFGVADEDLLGPMPTDRICRVKEHEREFGVFQQVQRR